MQLLRNIRIRLIGITVLTIIRFLFSISDALAGVVPAPASLYYTNLLLAFITGVATWEVNRYIVSWCYKGYSSAKESRVRFGKETVLLIVFNTLVYVVYLVVLKLIYPADAPPLVFLVYGALDRLLYGFLIVAFYELLIFAFALRRASEEAEELKKLNVTIQLESLKNQVKPHFLFNSLNTLTGLVETDQDTAVKFIAELSAVYRYLLQSNNKELISLGQELEFTEAYGFLLKMRFGAGMSLAIEVPEQKRSWMIPPLTVQMLVENALKHNQASPRKPLQIKINTEEDWLVVENNLQPRRQTSSNGIGLSNIAAKFRLLSQPELQILDEEGSFIIKVPLLKPLAA